MSDIQFSALICIIAFTGAVPSDNRMFIALCAFWVTVGLGLWKFLA